MRKSLSGVLALAALVMGCERLEQGPEFALNYDVFELRGGEESQVMSQCQRLEEGIGLGFGSFQPDYAVEYSFQPDVVQFDVSRNAGDSIVSRTYEADFFLEAREEVIEAPIDDELTLLFVHRGTSAGCDDVGGEDVPEFDGIDQVPEQDTGG